jgi:hypothetical protein
MEEEEAAKKTENKPIKEDKELYWILGAAIVVVALFLIFLSFRSSLGSFDYQGLQFEKTKFGDIPIYKYTYFSDKVIRTTGSVVRTNQTSRVTVLLRNDPRSLDIPVEGKIEYLQREQFVYVTVNSDLLCEYSQIAMADLSSFLSQNGFQLRAGVSNEAEAQAQNLGYITCEAHPDRMVISFEAGDEDKVTREGNCYTITVADCDILPPTEKFIIQSIIDAKS